MSHRLLMLLRRRSGAVAFSPLSLSPSIWLKADAGLYQDSALTTPATADGDPVGGWQDQSGNGRNIVQATAGKRPTLRLAIQNGLPMIRGDGTDDNIITSADYTVNQPATYYLVLRPRAVTVQKYAMDASNAAQTSMQAIKRDDNAGTTAHLLMNGEVGPNSSANVNNVWATNTTTIITWICNQASSSLQKDNGAPTALTFGNYPSGGMCLFSYRGGVQFGDFDIGEVLHYAAAHDATQQGNVRDYLNGRWGVY